MDARWKRFPPGGALLVPLGAGGRAAAAALSAHAACRPLSTLAGRAAAAWARVLGPGVLPGPAERWTPPLDAGEWGRLLETFRREAAPFDAFAVLERRQPHRAGMALLLFDRGAPAAFVKLRPLPAGGLDREADALARLARAAPRAFAAPAVLARGAAGGWGWLAASALPGPHRVPRDPRLDEVTADVRRALARLARPPLAPPHWEPMHGDLTPWNLRETPGGALLLYDWERAGWGPPGADEVLYRSAALALGAGPRRAEACPRECWPEAARYWAARLRARVGADAGEARLLRAQLALLDPEGGREAREAESAGDSDEPAGGSWDEDAAGAVPAAIGGGR